MSNGLMWVYMIGMTIAWVISFEYIENKVRAKAIRQGRRYSLNEVLGWQFLGFFIIGIIVIAVFL